MTRYMARLFAELESFGDQVVTVSERDDGSVLLTSTVTASDADASVVVTLRGDALQAFRADAVAFDRQHGADTLRRDLEETFGALSNGATIDELNRARRDRKDG